MRRQTLTGKEREPSAGMEGPQDQIPWPWIAGKEFVFYCQVEGEAFGLSWYQDLIRILSSHSGICIKRVGARPGVGHGGRSSPTF